MNSVEVSRKRCEGILRNSMLSFGYNRLLAETGAWSALWLEDRNFDGVARLINYLVAIARHGPESLKPRKDDEFGVIGICPFMMASAVIDASKSWFPKGGVSFGAPSEPFLMMASLADWSATRNCSVRFTYSDYTCLMSPEGMEIDGVDLSLVGSVDTMSRRQMWFTLTSDRPKPGVRKLDRIALPASRLRGKKALDLT